MNFLLPGANVKILARTVNCFSKIGNELFFEATPDGLELKTINPTNTAYAVTQFKQDFFISFQQGDTDTPEENCCKISVKPILKIFKSLSTIQTCKIWLDVAQSKIIFQFRCKSEVLKTHKIFLLESEHINCPILTHTFPSEIIGNHKIFSNMLLHLHHSVEEITFDLKEDKTIVSNFVDDEHLDRSTLRSALTINTNTFQSYKLDQKASLTFCYKEFKAITMFASFTRLDMQMSFSHKAGAPLILDMSKAGVVQMKVILGTMQPSPQLAKRRANRLNNSIRPSVNRSVLMDSEGINTLLTEDITHNSEPSPQARHSTSVRLNASVTHDMRNVAGERHRNSSQAASSAKTKKTGQDVVNDNLREDSAALARSSRSEFPVRANSLHDRQQKTGLDDGEPSSEAMFNTGTENFAFLDGINFPTAKEHNLNTLPSISDATAGRNGTGNAVAVQTLITDSDNELCEVVEPVSGSLFSRKRGVADSPCDRSVPSKKTCAETSEKPATEIVPESPEAIEERRRKQAKLRHIFRRCFEPTFNPAMQPGCSQIFAGNSDSEGES